jgi:hypothetical protein
MNLLFSEVKAPCIAAKSYFAKGTFLIGEVLRRIMEQENNCRKMH